MSSTAVRARFADHLVRWPLLFAAILLLAACGGDVAFEDPFGNIDRAEDVGRADDAGRIDDLARFVQLAICDTGCTDEPLTVAVIATAFENLEANVGVNDRRRIELNASAATTCTGLCGDQPIDHTQLRVIIWHWFGEPGLPLVEAGLVSNRDTVARAFFETVGSDLSVACAAPCAATNRDLLRLVDDLQRTRLLEGISAKAPVPADLVGVAPFWSATAWRQSDLLCLDPDGKPRYGMYTGGWACVSPELDPETRRDVAIHEMGHVWQVWTRQYMPDVEADADCWAHLHGAAVTFYVDSGCRDEAHRLDVLTSYAESLGL